MVHPALAIAAGIYIAIAAFTQSREEKTRGPAIAVMLLVLAQLCTGAVNVVLRAPIPMQIFHLLLADLLWIALILLFLRARETRPTASSSVSPC
jgi:cytochrome c oxidase assembly protein subunit 15/protoheme IX farnesyltransferase